MACTKTIIAAFALGCVLHSGLWLFADDRVELELFTQKGLSITGRQDWLRALSDAGASVRIRGEDESIEPKIATRGSGAAKTHVVTGIITAGNQLVVPGARFGIRDKQRIADWIVRLKGGGVEEVTVAKGAFGLTAEQLGEVVEELGATVSGDTKGVPVKKGLNAIAAHVKLKVVVAPTALREVASGDVLLDELNGLSTGTSLAAALRPFGLAFTLRKPLGGDPQIHVDSAANLEEAWPVGWPLEGSPKDFAPKLFNTLEVEITDTPLLDALEVVAGRLDMPLLFDHNGLAEARIEPADVKVSLPARKTYYKQIIDKLLGQAKLSAELRLDEVNRPFFWIAPIGR